MAGEPYAECSIATFFNNEDIPETTFLKLNTRNVSIIKGVHERVLV